MRGWLTPDAAPSGYEYRCFLLPVGAPDDMAQWEAILRGALLPLINPANFEQLEGITSDDTALVFETVFSFFVEGHMCLPIGSIQVWPGVTPPDGWLICNGDQVAQADYPTLYAICGALYGTADAGFFRLPNMPDRTVVGASASYPLASTGGESAHALTAAENARHAHGISNFGPGGATPGAEPVASLVGSGVTNFSGSGTAHNNMQPYTAMHWIIFAGLI